MKKSDQFPETSETPLETPLTLGFKRSYIPINVNVIISLLASVHALLCRCMYTLAYLDCYFSLVLRTYLMYLPWL